MPKLNQILAIESGVKKTTGEAETKIYHQLQKAELMEGLNRSYTPKDDLGEKLPDEVKNVQVTVDALVSDIKKVLSRLMDITATKDFANLAAVSDVVVDGETILKGVPVTYLLWLDKRLTDFHTVAKKIPVLNPTDTWTYDETVGYWRSAPVVTTKTKKVYQNHTKVAATDKFPAQVETYTEDVVVGSWTSSKVSGAWTADNVKALVNRVEKLQEAVKFSREFANSIDAPEVKVGDAIMGYLLGD